MLSKRIIIELRIIGVLPQTKEQATDITCKDILHMYKPMYGM